MAFPELTVDRFLLIQTPIDFGQGIVVRFPNIADLLIPTEASLPAFDKRSVKCLTFLMPLMNLVKKLIISSEGLKFKK
jgi:hypothetical protein